MTKPNPTRHDMMIDHGQPVALPPGAVKAEALRMMDEADILLVMLQSPSGDISVQVYGPPSMRLVESLEEAVRDFRTVTEKAIAADAQGRS